MRHDLRFRARIDRRFESLDALLRDDRPAQPPDELLALAGEHAPADDLDPSQLRLDERHGRGILSDRTGAVKRETQNAKRGGARLLLTFHVLRLRPWKKLRKSSKLSKTSVAAARTQPEAASRGIPRTR